jgi:putative spermidine/putrescine transport system substrate-binding protein
MKKKLISMAILTTMTVTLFGCGTSAKPESSNSGSSASKELVISNWGLNADKVNESTIKPFEDKMGVKIVIESGNNGERLTKLKNNPNSTVDVMYLAQASSEQGIADGLFEKLDYSKIPNATKLNDKAQETVKSGYGPAYTLNSIGIAYDKEKAGFEINSWEDLWRPELKGKIAIPDIATTFGPAMVQIAADKAKSDIKSDKGEAAFKELEALKANVKKTYSKSSDLVNMFGSGEIVAAVTADFAFGSVAKSNPQVKYIVPKSGTYLNFNTVNINKNSKNKELAYEFINYILGVEAQERGAKGVGDAPVNTDVKLTDDEAKYMTYGNAISNAKTIDFKFVNPLMNDWTDKWNRIMN